MWRINDSQNNDTPPAEINFFALDLINLPFADHSIGDNGTGAGAEAADDADYANLIANNNLAQNSWNYEFFNDPGTALENFNANDPGEYTIRLTAFDGSTQLAQSTITVISAAVPLPAALPMMAAAIGVFAFVGRRR